MGLYNNCGFPPLPQTSGNINNLNKGTVTATTATVQTVATNYVVTNYNRQPKTNDALFITLTDKGNDAVLFIYSEEAATWANSGLDVDLTNYVANFAQSFTDAQKTQARQNINAASIMVTVPDTTSTTASLEMEADRLYTFAQPLTALTVSSVADHCAIRFTAGASVAVSIPASVSYAVATPSFVQGSTYYLEFTVIGSSTVCVWSVL